MCCNGFLCPAYPRPAPPEYPQPICKSLRIISVRECKPEVAAVLSAAYLGFIPLSQKATGATSDTESTVSLVALAVYVASTTASLGSVLRINRTVPAAGSTTIARKSVLA